jgi:glyoxylase-like metal-dependent hydrolase (beta-lactamase superfamily II)
VARIELSGHDLIGIRADNPGPFTLEGTNSWLVGSGPSWLVDPGPALDSHVAELVREITARGGLGGIALTHDHADHSAAVAAIRERYPDAPLAAARGAVDVALRDGTRFGPLEALSTPGHAPDHLAFVAATVGLSGDAVLGAGSVFIAPDPQALAGYLEGLEKLRERHLQMLAPGHGPPIADPEAKLTGYIEHRLDRERRLLAALQGGARSVPEMLEAAWDDVPEILRPAATVTLAAHLDKLADEGRLPDGAHRPVGFALTEPPPGAAEHGR